MLISDIKFTKLSSIQQYQMFAFEEHGARAVSKFSKFIWCPQREFFFPLKNISSIKCEFNTFLFDMVNNAEKKKSITDQLNYAYTSPKQIIV